MTGAILPIEKRGQILEATDSFMIAISYNPGYQTVLKDLKQSTKQRFITLDFEYPPASIEEEIVVRESGVDPKSARDLRKVAEKIRGLKDRGLDEGVSTRLLIYAGVLIKRGVRATEGLYGRPHQTDHRRSRDPEDPRRDRLGSGMNTLSHETSLLDGLVRSLAETLGHGELVEEACGRMASLLDEEGMLVYFRLVDEFISLDRSLALSFLQRGAKTLETLKDPTVRKGVLEAILGMGRSKWSVVEHAYRMLPHFAGAEGETVVKWLHHGNVACGDRSGCGDPVFRRELGDVRRTRPCAV